MTEVLYSGHTSLPRGQLYEIRDSAPQQSCDSESHVLRFPNAARLQAKPDFGEIPFPAASQSLEGLDGATDEFRASIDHSFYSECVSKIAALHFRRLCLHFCIAFPGFTPSKPAKKRLEMKEKPLETAALRLEKYTLIIVVT